MNVPRVSGDRTAEDLLGERRSNALELHRETCPVARAMLEFHIAKLDHELGGLAS